MPNPQTGSTLNLSVNLENDAESLVVRFYTKAMTELERKELQGPFHAGWNQASVALSQAPSVGLYYVVVTGRNSEGEEATSGVAKVFYLR